MANPSTKKKKRKKEQASAATAEEGEDAQEPTAELAKSAVEKSTEGSTEKPTEKTQKLAEQSNGASEGNVADRAYRSAAVVFFTKNDRDEVSRVLVALEERKVQASSLGLDQKGKVNEQMVVFPMGRKEKKDNNDCVETVKREYIEETTNYGGLAKYLDFADFDGDDTEERGPDEWTGKTNMAVFFAPASMVFLFCEIPVAAAAAAESAPPRGSEVAGSEAAPAAGEAGTAGPQTKKRRKDLPLKPSPNYHVGKTDHLQPCWIDVAELRRVMQSSDRAPILQVKGKDCRIFPTVASALRLPEARAFLGLPSRTEVADAGSKPEST